MREPHGGLRKEKCSHLLLVRVALISFKRENLHFGVIAVERVVFTSIHGLCYVSSSILASSWIQLVPFRMREVVNGCTLGRQNVGCPSGMPWASW